MAPYHHGGLPTALLEAAEAIVERDGIAALTLRATAREAGVSHAAPAHHYRDLSGLLTELAASGFVRLRAFALSQSPDPDHGQTALLALHAQGYIAFARAHPGLFQLMFRSERLDWSNPVLATAGEAAFALLTLPDIDPSAGPLDPAKALVSATARWAFVHGMAMLLIDGRLQVIADQLPGSSLEALIADLLNRLARQ